MKDLRSVINHFPSDATFWFLHSHPDDESYLTAGLMQQLASRGHEIHVIYLSAGVCESRKVSHQRQSEAVHACDALNIKNLHFLNYCESSCQEKDHRRINEADLQVVRDEILTLHNCGDREKEEGGSRVFFSYDEKGGYGHVDHVSLHKVGQLIREKGYLVLEATLNQNRFFEWIRISKACGLDKKLLPLESYWIEEPWLTEEQISYFYKLTSQELQYKKQALLEHVSQVHPDQFPGGLSLDDFQQVFGVEYFVRPVT
jgi:LmbE family N-acetylglucosaminyl deacetylase